MTWALDFGLPFLGSAIGSFFALQMLAYLTRKDIANIKTVLLVLIPRIEALEAKLAKIEAARGEARP
jgi:hypothetical protein